MYYSLTKFHYLARWLIIAYSALLTACSSSPSLYTNTTSDTRQQQRPTGTTSTTPYDNQTLAHTALSSLLADHKLADLHLQVVSYHGKLLIVGEAPTQEDIDNIAIIIEHVSGVSSIDLEIELGPNLSTEQQIEDSITHRHIKKILRQSSPSHSHLQAIVNNQRVFLLGPIRESNKQDLVLAINNLPNVKSVMHSR